MKIEHGVGWVPSDEGPGHIRSANPGEYVTEIERLQAENARLRNLVQTIYDNDPAGTVADNGMTVLDAWREQAKPYVQQS